MYFDGAIVAEYYLMLARKIRNLSDRDTLTIITAYIDDFVCRLLRARLIHDGKKQLWFESQNFGITNKLHLAYAVGLISNDIFNNLTYIVKIRNKFAHIPDNDFLESKQTYDIFCKHFAFAKDIITAIEKDIDAVRAKFKISREDMNAIVDEKFKYKKMLCVVVASLNSTSAVKRLECVFKDSNHEDALSILP